MSRKVLVVKDHKKMREMLASLISRAGFEVTEAINGRERLEKAGETLPDLILVDDYMPILDGPDMIRELRQMPTFESVPIILLSADLDFGSEAVATGADHFMTKPM